MRPCDLVAVLVLASCASAPPVCVRSAPAIPLHADDVFVCRSPGGAVVELVQGHAPGEVRAFEGGRVVDMDCRLVAMGAP